MSKEERKYEEWESFIPASRLKKVEPLPQESELSDSQDNIKRRVDAISELKNVDKNTYTIESEKLRQFYHAIVQFYPDNKPPETIKLIEKIASTLNIEKITRYETCRGLLQNYMINYGVTRYSSSPGKRLTWTNSDYLIEIFEFLESFKNFFEDVMPIEDYDYFLRTCIGEAVMPFYIVEADDPVWVAEKLDMRMEQIKKIANMYKTVSPEQINDYEHHAGLSIGEILKHNLTDEFYSEDTYEDKEKIKRLQTKYRITLPSKSEFLTAKLAKTVAEVELLIAEIESKTTDPYLKNYLEETSLQKLTAYIEKIISENSENLLPSNAKPFTQWIDSINARIQNARQDKFTYLLEKANQDLFETIEIEIVQKNPQNVEKAIQAYQNFVHTWKEFINKEQIFKDKFTELITKIDSLIEILLSVIKNDPSKTEEQASNLLIYGKIRKILEQTITSSK